MCHLVVNYIKIRGGSRLSVFAKHPKILTQHETPDMGKQPPSFTDKDSVAYCFKILQGKIHNLHQQPLPRLLELSIFQMKMFTMFCLLLLFCVVQSYRALKNPVSSRCFFNLLLLKNNVNTFNDHPIIVLFKQTLNEQYKATPANSVTTGQSM